MNALQLRRRDDRTDVGRRLEAVPQTELLRAADELVDEILGHALVSDHARCCGAPLSRRAEGRPDDPVERKVHVRVVENDDGVLAAELAGHALEKPAAYLADVRTRVGRAVERHQVRPGMRDEVVAEVSPRPEHKVQDTLRQAALLEYFDDPHRQERRLATRLSPLPLP